MGELRYNGMTGGWVVVAPARGRRPLDVVGADEPPRPRYALECPFCPGNEERLPAILWELRNEASEAGEVRWHTRAVPNRYPAFSPLSTGLTGGKDSSRNRVDREDRGGGEHGDDSPCSRPAVGHQEVLIETPRHDLDPSRLAPRELSALVESYHRRYLHLSALPEVAQVFLFRNHRPEAGISLLHPHSQLVATAFVPPSVEAREERMIQHHRRHGDCFLCGIVHAGTEGGASASRIVRENRSFICLVPWAAEGPFEVWVVPRRHRADFAEVDATEREALAEVLGGILQAYRKCAGDPAYNYMVETSGAAGRGRPELHWFLRILPRISRRAGFEIGSGISMNPSSPEEDAALLRAC